MSFLRTVAGGVLATMILAGSASAAWPEKPVTIIVPAAPGGTTDIVARLVGEKMSKILGQTVVVENKAGAAGIIGSQALVRSKPDGYTLGMGNVGPNAINYSLYKTLPYKKEDFKPITLVISVPNVLVVNSETPVKSVSELVAYLAANEDRRTFGSSGKGQSPHLSAEMFLQRIKQTAQHVPYKGAGPAVSGLLGNQYTFMIDNLPSSLPSIQSGKFRALAVTGEQRSEQLPDVPTMKEAGIDNMVVNAWFGLVAPAGTPDDIVGQLQQAAKQALQSDDIIARFKSLGGTPGGNTPAAFATFINDQQHLWADTVHAANLQMQ
ncbi:Bug family tripartite tricarboxylate transporter substrate binding protein [Advenella mimigardefordensis]|uniref:Putative Bug-like extracytoplasmic solute binding receptor, TTT family n=1 Tax=Advenella mimigardefordensis (strain DSM 17166 / LMG 22922 / DPN7) TaxID=1247726 RepID=W0PEC8_ADVMD|nr:tripartite tricarboxylate transporter substrate binding protein [Advenella mimigardefordensis]AHG65151.1 putative Bug-like extracytoplasmic solute binding receptor, TTT family [Advenella mimigardefordensis DPN7]